MTAFSAFALLFAATLLFPIAAWRLAQHSRRLALSVASASLLALLGFVVAQREPGWVARWIEHTDLAVLLPSAGAVPAVALLAAIGPLAAPRLRRALLALTVCLGGYCVWDASRLLQAPAQELARENLPVDVFYQSTPWSCAPAAAVSLVRSLGIPANEAELARLMHTRPHRGTGDLQAQYGLARKLEPYGRTAHLRNITWQQLVASGGRALVPVSFGPFDTHMIAVLDADLWSATVVDPITGPQRLLREQLESVWLGRAIVVTPDLPWYEALLASR